MSGYRPMACLDHSNRPRRQARRSLVAACVAGTLSLALPNLPAHAQGGEAAATFPSRALRLVVGFPPGQTTDVIARAYASALAPILNVPVIVDNKGGANGIVAAQLVKAADPDGYTLLFGTSGQLAINPALYAKLPYNTLTDYVPVAPIARGRLFLVVNNDLPVRSLKDLLAYAKAHPKSLNFGSGGTGITSHLAMEMLKSATGLNASHVPYNGSPAALVGLMTGDVQIMFDSGGSLLPQVNNGKVRAIAVSTLDRYAQLPDVQTVAEQGAPGFEIYAWNAVLAPLKTPPAIVEKLNVAFKQAGQSDAVKDAIRNAAHDPLVMDLPQLGRFMQSETRRWGQAASAAGISPE